MTAALSIDKTDDMWDGIRFSADEYRRRLEALRLEMSGRDIAAAVVSDERMVWYLTGYGDAVSTGSRARPRIVIVTLDGDLTLFVQNCQHTAATEICWFADVRSYPDLGAPIDLLVTELERVRVPTLGLELGGELTPGLTMLEVEKLRARLPTMRFVDVSPAAWAVRAVKSDEELARIRRACEITSDAYRDCFASISAGMTEREVAHHVGLALRRYGADADWTSVMSGVGDYGRVDAVPRNRRLLLGDLVFIDCGANVGGYWADFSRSGVIGGASEEQARLQELIWEITCIGVDGIHPGRTVGDVARDIGDAMKHHQLIFGSASGRYGHGLGMAVTEPPNVSENDETSILPGMVLTIEPNVINRHGIFHCEQNVIVTEAGNEVISRSPWQLRELGDSAARA